MSITISVSVSRKLGTENYGSVGASCEVHGIEVPASDPAETARLRDYWLGFCEASVHGELASLRGARRRRRTPTATRAAPRRPAAEPSPESPPPRKERREWGTADRGEAARPSHGTRRGASSGDREKAPRTGGALTARLKDLDEADDSLGVLRHVRDWAKARGNDAKMKDWDDRDVADGWREATKHLEALANSESLQAGY